MTDVATNPILTEEAAPTSSRNKVRQRVAVSYPYKYNLNMKIILMLLGV